MKICCNRCGIICIIVAEPTKVRIQENVSLKYVFTRCQWNNNNDDNNGNNNNNNNNNNNGNNKKIISDKVKPNI